MNQPKPKHIIAVTGARSEYDLLTPVYEKLHTDARFELGLIVTGAHFAPSFGHTVSQIEADGFPIVDRIYSLPETNEKIGRVVSLGHELVGISHSLTRLRPDMVLIAGDREESLATTIACGYLGIACGHFFGGDIAHDGHIDNSARHAASKFAHLHFCCSEVQREVLLRLGEEDWRIKPVGSPALDKFIRTPWLSREELSQRLQFELGDAPFLLIVQHSTTGEESHQREHIRLTLEAAAASGLKAFINYPNSDAGHLPIIEEIESFAQRYPNQFYPFKNLARETYINIMRHAAAMLGNSSSGLAEAPTLHLPVVNIGTRQRGRLHGRNVQFVDNDADQIKAALHKALYDEDYRILLKSSSNPYGNGNTSEAVVEILADLEINDFLLKKIITYPLNT